VAKKLWYVALGDLSRPYIAATIHCREDVRGLRKCGWDATLYSQADGPVNSPADVPETVVCKNRPIVFRVVFEILMIFRLLFSRRKPDFVLFRLTGTLLFGMVLWLMRVPFGVELCGPPACFLKQRLRRPWGYLSSRFFLKHASVIVTLMREMAPLAGKIKHPDSVVVVTGVGVNSEDYQLAGAPNESADGPVLGFLGTVYADRGLDWTLQAVSQLRARGLHARLVIVGDGAYRQEAEKIADGLDIGDHVDFKGWVLPENVSEALSPCDLMVAIYRHTPSLTIGGINPMKVWTSLAVGKPVLLHNPGSSDSYCRIPGVLCCPRTDPSDLADRIDDIWRTEGRSGLIRAGLSGRDYVAREVTWLGHAKRIDEAIRRFCRTREHAPQEATGS